MKGIAGLADIEAIEAAGWPADLPSSTYEAIRRSAEKYPELPALSFFLQAANHALPVRWNYRELLDQIHRAANVFHALGAGKDTVIAYVLPNLPETHWVIWGGEATGIVAAINPMLEGPAIADLLTAAGASMVVTLAPAAAGGLWQKLQPVCGQVPGLKHVLWIDPVGGTVEPAADTLPRSIQGHDFRLLLAQAAGDRLLSDRVIHPDDHSSYFFTGGTTGQPKLAMRTHRNEVANAWSVSHFFGTDIGPGKNMFCGLPMFHVNAVMVTGLLPFFQGAHVVLGSPEGYRGEGVVARFWEIVEHHRIHFFSGVPTLYASLLQVPRGHRRVDSLEYGLCGAAPMPKELFRRFQEETGIKILEGYGLTEGSCVSSVNPPFGERRIGSIGIRLPGQKMRSVIKDSEGNYLRDAEPLEPGSIVISGPNVFTGYKLAEQNRDLWLQLGDDQRWMDTGDLGYRDADGYFWLTGRSKELIIRGGHNIDPAIIEQPLHAHPDVQLAAAVGRPDPYAGELPVVYVQRTPGGSAGEAELLEHLVAHVGERAAIPKAVVIIEQMPLTPVGKIFKPELKRRQIEFAIRHALDEKGIRVEAVDTAPDPRHGMSTTIRLAPGASRAAAQDALTSFALAYEFA